MHRQLLDMDEHACIWPALVINARHVDGKEDITIGTHPELGTCVVQHYGFSPLVEWSTRRPIPDELLEHEENADDVPVCADELAMLVACFASCTPRENA